MNNFLKLLIPAACLSGLLTVMCNDDSGPSGSNEPEPILFDDYVVFDTSQFMIQRSTIQRSTQTWTDTEWYPRCEASLGEPYVDVNGNGVYDLGIDMFVMSVGPDNMDLNNNGKHDGPDDPWEPGIPFDDYNGDGERFCNHEPWDPPHSWEYGLPFCDMNGNGQWDSVLALGHNVVKWGVVDFAPNGLHYLPVREDSLFWHISDSGVQHWYPVGPVVPSTTPWVHLFVDDSGVVGHISVGELRLLYRGNNLADTARVPFSTTLCRSASLRRTRQTNQTLEIEGTTFRDMLLIKFDDPRDDSGLVVQCQELYWEYYFAKTAGLIALHSQYGSREETWFYFDQRFDSAQPMMFPVVGCIPARSEVQAVTSQ